MVFNLSFSTEEIRSNEIDEEKIVNDDDDEVRI
jgi:hypothetical protein